MFDPELDRRGFLGSMVGIALSKNFLALPVQREPQILTPAFRYRTGLILESGDIIQGTGLVDSVLTEHGWMVTHNPLRIVRQVTVIGSVLCDKFGKIQFEDMFRGGRQTLFDGDQLFVTHTITADPRRN